MSENYHTQSREGAKGGSRRRAEDFGFAWFQMATRGSFPNFFLLCALAPLREVPSCHV